MFSTSEMAVGVPGQLPPEEASEAAAEGQVTPEHAETALLAKLLTWYYHERDRQAENRMEMAIDHDFVDGLQWREEDAKKVEDRGQAPLVYNEVAVGMRWITGTEKRERTDWRILPREDADTEMATVKTKVMKYVSDTNRVPFVRSQAFEEAAICGLSFLEDSINADPQEDILYSGWESWRNCLHDSYDRRMDGKGWRYFFRWRHMDLDIAKMMFPGKAAALEREANDAQQLFAQDMDDIWYLGDRLNPQGPGTTLHRRSVISNAVTEAFSRRERVKILECWYKEPVETPVVRGGPYHGEVHDPNHPGQQRSMQEGYATVELQPLLRMKVCYFLEHAILATHDSPFKHNDFPFTPIYCFRRGRDGMPYGFVRNQRDPQEDLNKRMSKSLFILSVNQLITEKGAFSDVEGEYTLQDAIDNVSNPNGVFVLKDGSKRFEIRRDFAEAEKQMALVQMNRQFIQSGSGITDELLGRRTNAVSGEAIRARQDQGSATTGNLFDNYRLAIQCSGSKQLSNAEHFYTMPKVIRLTGEKGATKGAIDWVRVNQPEVMADGTVRFLNDITASRADYIVDEQDFRSSMRQAAFDSLQEMVAKIMAVNPEWAIKLYPLVMDVADFPGKEEIVEQLKALANPPPPTEQKLAKAAEQDHLAKETVVARIAKDQAAANKADAEADRIRVLLPPNGVATDLTTVPQGGMPPGGAAPVPGGAAASPQPAVAGHQAAAPGSSDGGAAMMAQAINSLAQLSASIAQSVQQSNMAIAQALEAVAANTRAKAQPAEEVKP